MSEADIIIARLDAIYDLLYIMNGHLESLAELSEVFKNEGKATQN